MDKSELGRWIKQTEATVEPITDAGLAGVSDILHDVLRARLLFKDLTAEIDFTRQTPEQRWLYARFILSVCRAALRDVVPGRTDVMADLDIEHNATARKYIEQGIAVGHFTFETDPADGRRQHVRPTDRTMHVFRRDIAAVARLVTRVAALDEHQQSAIEQHLRQPRE